MENTVIITGAGFSMPYGYPSGKELVEKIIQYKKSSSFNDNYKKLASDLEDSQIVSIDKFLNEHPEHSEIGITAISNEIYFSEISIENPEIYKSENKKIKNDDIISLLLNEIEESDFSQLKVITFNYDRHFIHTLYKKLKLKYRTSVEDAMKALKKLRIVHIHGRMIPFNPFDLENVKESNQCVAYGYTNTNPARTTNEPLALINQFALENFKTVHTNKKEVNTEVIKILKEARRVFFLGFGFDEMNMLKLGINPYTSSSDSLYDWKNKVVGATALGLHQIKIKEIMDKYYFLNKDNLHQCTARELFELQYSLKIPKYDAKFKAVESCCVMIANQMMNTRQKDGVALQFDFRCGCCYRKKTAYCERENAHVAWRVRTVNDNDL